MIIQPMHLVMLVLLVERSPLSPAPAKRKRGGMAGNSTWPVWSRPGGFH